MNHLEHYIKSLNGALDAGECINKFSLYRDYLLEQNKLFNLTAITEPDEVEEKHFIDSLTAYKYVSGNVADIGSGAGFPGIPLKILMPENEFTLIDSLNKRVSFLQSVIGLLNLRNVTAVHGRAEDLDKNRKFDTVVARAVSRLNTLSEYCLPFVKVGGLFIAYKSNDSQEEINEAKYAIKILGGEIEKTETVVLPVSDIQRKLVLIRKIKDCPTSYPRGQNKPKKQPLLGK